MSVFESRVRAYTKQRDELEKKISVFRELGVYCLIIDCLDENPKNLSGIFKNLLLENPNMELHFRYTLVYEDIKKFKRELNKFNNYPYILAVESPNVEIYNLAARDSRVDLLSFSELKYLNKVTPGILSLIKQNNKFIEFSFAPLMEDNRVKQSKNFRKLYRFLNLALKAKVRYILSGNFDNIYDFRHPRALMSICMTLLDLNPIQAKEGFQKYPSELIKRINNRKNYKSIEDGVNIL
ncbi:MAG: hypothetical protein EU544_01870 [Promethearchaeota archaeon]|nr:MAG: hypothetical protein EU544_01870 [Candidatus Lokiarchaeota archaeon]